MVSQILAEVGLACSSAACKSRRVGFHVSSLRAIFRNRIRLPYSRSLFISWNVLRQPSSACLSSPTWQVQQAAVAAVLL